MQTFLPLESYRNSARVLDRQRLGKQRVEVFQLLRALNGESKGWVNHPAARMWRGYENSLVIYGRQVCAEWIERGYKDTMKERISQYWRVFNDNMESPPWRGDGEFHRSHQSNLIRKLPDHYRWIFPGVPHDLPYVWPVND